jgi:predicted RecB family nuclease
MVERLNWRLEAECRNTPKDVFYPKHSDYDKAKEFCNRCVVKADCLGFALKQEADYYGMFGGLTPAERSLLRERGVRNG